jgi:hypothetical protein
LAKKAQRERERERERERRVLVMRHLQNMVFIVYKSTKQRDKGKKKVRLISGQRDTHRLTQTLKSLNPKSLNPSGGRKEDLDNNIPFSSI